MQSIRVVVVDDHAVVREGTRQLLEQDPTLRVEAEAGCGVEALRLVRLHAPDVLLLDLALPDMSGIEVARQIAAEQPAVRIVVLSAYDDDDYVTAALEAGVAAYLLKTAPIRDVIAAIQAVVDGQIILHPAVAAKLRQSLRHHDTRPPRIELTDREREVLRLAASGMHNKEIAAQLVISIRTVEAHFSHILAKLGVSSRTEAVVFALAQGWVHANSLAGPPGPISEGRG